MTEHKIKYTLTPHALQRFFERIGKGTSEHHATHWTNQILGMTEETVPDHNGRMKRYYKDYCIVCDDSRHQVVTIMKVDHRHRGLEKIDPEVTDERSDLERQIDSTVEGMLTAALTDVLEKRRQVALDYHLKQAERLSIVQGPQREIAAECVDRLRASLSAYEEKLSDISRIAVRYHINLDGHIDRKDYY